MSATVALLALLGASLAAAVGLALLNWSRRRATARLAAECQDELSVIINPTAAGHWYWRVGPAHWSDPKFRWEGYSSTRGGAETAAEEATVDVRAKIAAFRAAPGKV